MINRIYQNELGITKFNKYFSYLKDIRNKIDPYIYEFFSDERKYQLRGERTLHDSWIQDFKISRELKTVENTNSSIELRLLLADWENVLILNYYDAFFEKIPFEIFDEQHLQNDLLVHELQWDQQTKRYRHIICFDNDVDLVINFAAFKYSYINAKQI